jgi:hypothetical protein
MEQRNPASSRPILNKRGVSQKRKQGWLSGMEVDVASEWTSEDLDSEYDVIFVSITAPFP